MAFVNELSLFSGAGGGILASKLLGWRTVGYVERDAYCQAVLKARIQDGIFDPAPIFGDIREFLVNGWADSYRGVADVVSAGFPCQPFSCAGKQKGADDERNMWPETIGVIRAVRPRYAWLENVPGLLAHEYFGTVLGDLAEAGFDAEWTVLGADDVGAPHRRKRLWILAYSVGVGDGWRGGAAREETGGRTFGEAKRSSDMANHDDARSQGHGRLHICGDGSCERTPWACSRAVEDDRLARSGIRRVSHGIPNRVHRLRALGNAQLPAVASTAFRILRERI